MLRIWMLPYKNGGIKALRSEGPYIELLKEGGMSSMARKIMRLIGKGEFMDRFDYWANAPQESIKAVELVERKA